MVSSQLNYWNGRVPAQIDRNVFIFEGDKKVMLQESWQLVANQESMPSRVYAISMIQGFSNKRFDLTEGSNIVGRDESCCDIVLPGMHVSRKHAELIINNGSVLVRDLNSANGTYVNGELVKESVINPGDEICFDTITLTLFAPEQNPDATVIYDRGDPYELDGTVFRDDAVRVEQSSQLNYLNAARYKDASQALPTKSLWRRAGMLFVTLAVVAGLVATVWTTIH